MSFSAKYIDEVTQIAGSLDARQIDLLAERLAAVRERGGRLFFLGVGGGAGHAGHAVNDFRKIAAFEAYAPTDNVSKSTARINDDGWETAFAAWLEGSCLTPRDAGFAFSVGGGNLVRALDYARGVGASIFAIVGRDGGHAARVADCCVIVPTIILEHETPHTESFQAVIWHLLASHPAVKAQPTKWEIVP